MTLLINPNLITQPYLNELQLVHTVCNIGDNRFGEEVIPQYVNICEVLVVAYYINPNPENCETKIF